MFHKPMALTMYSFSKNNSDYVKYDREFTWHTVSWKSTLGILNRRWLFRYAVEFWTLLSIVGMSSKRLY